MRRNHMFHTKSWELGPLQKMTCFPFLKCEYRNSPGNNYEPLDETNRPGSVICSVDMDWSQPLRFLSVYYYSAMLKRKTGSSINEREWEQSMILSLSFRKTVMSFIRSFSFYWRFMHVKMLCSLGNHIYKTWSLRAVELFWAFIRVFLDLR